jgi:hypothetical protein
VKYNEVLETWCKVADSNVTDADWEDTEKQERRDGRLPEGSPTRKRSVAGQRPHYLDLEEARQLLGPVRRNPSSLSSYTADKERRAGP